MPEKASLFLIIAGGIMLAGYLLVYHYQQLGRILVRTIGGVCAIVIINYLLSVIEIKSGVGVNVYTMLAAGFLGVQGLLFLYLTAGFLALFY